jgi:hypothetical protein
MMSISLFALLLSSNFLLSIISIKSIVIIIRQVGCTHHLPHHLLLIFLLSINYNKHIDNNYFKNPQLHAGLPTSLEEK